ncbi:MAG: hypothetical protein AAF310_02485 [Myxococcota bacterium]
MDMRDKRWKQSMACCWLPTLLVGCGMQHETAPRQDSMQLPDANHKHDPPAPGDYTQLKSIYPSSCMSWVPHHSLEEPEAHSGRHTLGRLLRQSWVENRRQNPRWKMHGREVSHFLDVPGLEKQEHRRQTAVAVRNGRGI